MDRLTIDFTSGAVAHRRRFGGGRGQALPRAIGMKSGNTPFVVDATAGLGRDSFLLASLGATVTLIERSETIHALLAEALEKASNDEQTAPIIARMTLVFGDARSVLPGLSPDVVLVDPMHPPRKSSALVKQDMRALRDVVGSDSDACELMDVALRTASKRVVLKWPLRAEQISGIRPASHQIIGKSIRYDVFMLG